MQIRPSGSSSDRLTAADLRIAQDFRKCLGVRAGCPLAVERRIAVVGGGQDQRGPSLRCVSGGWHFSDPELDEPVLLLGADARDLEESPSSMSFTLRAECCWS
jgi:hypothetical protein